MNLRNILALEKIDWDFIDAITNTTTNTYHPYPAKYIPQIPHHFILELSQRGEIVYDPFMGSGTTALEANILGRNAIGNDVNELAVLISKVKTTPIKPKELKKLDSLSNQILNRLAKHYNPSLEKVIFPNIINLDQWFKGFVIEELVVLKEEIQKLQDQDLVDFCLVALSSIIVNVSNQDSDTRYVRVPKKLKKNDVFVKFVRQLNKMKNIMLDCYSDISQGESEFKVADTRDAGIFEENSASLAITSPPYPNAYDYHLYHKYRLFWLDMNPNDLRKKEIGAHADYSKKNGPDEFDFQNDMEQCFDNTSQVLKKGGYFVLVIGNSILKGRNIQNNEILKNAAKNTPFSFVAEFSRNLNLRKKSFNPKIGNIKTEKIVIFENLK